MFRDDIISYMSSYGYLLALNNITIKVYSYTTYLCMTTLTLILSVIRINPAIANISNEHFTVHAHIHFPALVIRGGAKNPLSSHMINSFDMNQDLHNTNTLLMLSKC